MRIILLLLLLLAFSLRASAAESDNFICPGEQHLAFSDGGHQWDVGYSGNLKSVTLYHLGFGNFTLMCDREFGTASLNTTHPFCKFAEGESVNPPNYNLGPQPQFYTCTPHPETNHNCAAVCSGAD